MFKSSVNYLMQLADPFVSTASYPVKLFSIPIASIKYKIRYTPVTLHSGLLMADYLLASNLKLSDGAFNGLQEALKDQFKSVDEFIVIEGSRADVGATEHSLAYYGQKEDTRSSDINTIEFKGQLIEMTESEVVDNFIYAYRNLRRNTAQISFLHDFIRDRRHSGAIHSSVDFLRDRVHGVEISLVLQLLRDYSKDINISHTINSLRDYVRELEISHVVRAERDSTSDLVMVNGVELLREDSFYMSYPSVQAFKRDYIHGLNVNHSHVVADRQYIFGLIKEFYITGERPIKKKGDVRWEHILAERIIDSDMTVQASILYAERLKSKKGSIGHSYAFERNRLMQTIISYGLDQAKLKARQYPSIKHFGLLDFDRLIQRDYDVLQFINSDRDIVSDLVMPTLTNSVRDISSPLFNKQHLTPFQRDIRTETEKHFNLIHTKRDKVHSMYLTLTEQDYLINARRDFIDRASVMYTLGRSLRDSVHNGKLIYGDLKPFERDITSDMHLHYNGVHSERIYQNKQTEISYADNIFSERDIASNMTITRQSNRFERDVKSGLYLVKGGTSERKIDSKKMDSFGGIHSERKKSKLLHLSELTPSERNNIKDLLLSYIGDYVRSNLHNMGGNEHPPQTDIGATIPSKTFPAYLMEDEVFADLVDGYADIINTIYLGESVRPLQGSMLADKMLAVRERIEGFINVGLLQGTSKDRGGIVMYPNMQALVERGFDIHSVEMGGRTDSNGIINQGASLGTRKDSEGQYTESIIGERPLSEGLTDEDKFALGYINADPSEFLSPEELASLPDNRGGIVRNEAELGTHPIEIEGNLDKNEFVELLGFHSILLDSHLHEDMIIATPIIKVLHGVIHETIEAVTFDGREAIIGDDTLLGTVTGVKVGLLDTSFLQGDTVRFGSITEYEHLADFKGKEIMFPEVEYFANKTDFKSDLLGDIQAYKEKIAFTESEITASRPQRLGLIETEIDAIKEKLVYLEEMLTSYRPDRNFFLEEFTFADKDDKAGFIESKEMLAKVPDKHGLIVEQTLGSRPDKSGIIDNEIVGEIEKVSVILDSLEGVIFKDFVLNESNEAEKYSYGHVITDNVHGTLIRPLNGTVIDLPIFGGRDKEFNAWSLDETIFSTRFNEHDSTVMTEFKAGERDNLFEGHTLTDISLGERVNGFSSDVLVETVLGQRDNLNSSDYLGDYYLGTKISDAASINKESILASKYIYGYIGHDIMSEKFIDGVVEGEYFVASNPSKYGTVVATVIDGVLKDKYATLNDVLMADKLEKVVFIETSPIVAVKNPLEAVIETTIDLIKEHEGRIEELLLAERNSKYAYVEEGYLADRTDKEGHLVETYLADYFPGKGQLEQLLHAATPLNEGIIEPTDLLGSYPNRGGNYDNFTDYLFSIEYSGADLVGGYSLIAKADDKEGLIIEQELSKMTNGIVRTSLMEDEEEYLSTIPQKMGATPSVTHEANILEKYGITEANLVEAETYMWVGILTNLLFADEEQGKSYVEYLDKAGVIKEKDYELLNGLVGDLVKKQGLAYGTEVYADIGQVKAELIEGLQGQGLIYDYHDFEHVLNPGMDIEEWEYDLGYGLPEKYDPYDPYNSYYPYLIDNYSHSGMAFSQLEDWVLFGGNNWERDKIRGIFRSVADNEKGNGYYYNKQGMTDYKMSVDFIVDADADENDGVGIVFKYTNELNYYKFVIVGSPSNNVGMSNTTMQLYKVVNGVSMPMGSALSPETYVKGEYHNVKISYVNKEILIWVNDRLQYEIIDY